MRVVPRVFSIHLIILGGLCASCLSRPAPPPSSSPPPASPLSVATSPTISTAVPSLHHPDPAGLLRVLNYGIGLEQEAWEKFDYGNFTGDFLTSPEARLLFDYVQADFNRYYARGIPRAGQLLTDGALDPNIWFPPRAVWTLIQAGVADLMREAGLRLEPGESLPLSDFTLTPIQLELDGDPAPEWMVEVDSERYNLRGWLPFDEQEGKYILLPNRLSHENQARASGVTTHISPSLNGDAAFVVHFDGQPLGTSFGYLKVYGWVKDGVYLLESIPINPGEAVEISDNEVRITIPHTLNFDCFWTQTNTYRWQSGEPMYTFADELPPETPVCQAARALSPFPNLTPAERAVLLETALQNFSTEPAPGDDYLALLHIHLALAYASQGLDEQALVQMAALPDWVGTLWEAENQNFPAFCHALYVEAGRGTFDATGLGRYFSPGIMFQAFGHLALDPGMLVCPLQEWAAYRLETLTPPLSRIPGEFWPELGAVLSGAAYPLDDDPEEEWITWLDWKEPQFLLLNPHEDTWQLVRLGSKSNALSRFQSRVTDFDKDGIPDILLLATFDASVPVSAYSECWARGASQVSELMALHWMDGVVSKVGEKVLCGEPPALTGLAAEELQGMFIPAPSGPPTLETDPNGFYHLLGEQENALFEGRDPAGVRTALEGILSGVPGTHPASGVVIPRILFAIGLSYEVEGETDAALSAYKDLIAQWPASPWAWLAETRMGGTLQ